MTGCGGRAMIVRIKRRWLKASSMEGAAMSYEYFVVETNDHVSTVTMNRPDKLNALSHSMTREFHVVLDDIEAQFPDVRAIIITGTGRGFCSGADVVEQRASLDGGGEQPPPGRIHAPRTVSITALAPRLRSLPQATIAAVNGVLLERAWRWPWHVTYASRRRHPGFRLFSSNAL